MLTSPRGPCIVGWSVISPIGIGSQAFDEALGAGRSGCKRLADDFPVPLETAFTIPEFETVKFLGARGTRTMDRMTAMVIATAEMILRAEETIREQEPDSLGMVLGTSTGSIASITDFTRDTFVNEKPYFVNPAAFPNTVMNCAAGQSAIWHKLRGVNSTVCGGQLTSLLALRYATRMISRRYADTLLVGGVEEFSTPVAWADLKIRDAELRRLRPLGEGCAMFLIDNAEVARARCRAVLAELVGFEFSVHPALDGDDGDNQRAGLATCIRTALERAGLSAGDVHTVSAAQCGGPAVDAVENAAIDEGLGGATPACRLNVSDLVGNCFSASGAFQLAAVLATSARFPADRARVSLVTSVGDDGAVGCALLKT